MICFYTKELISKALARKRFSVLFIRIIALISIVLCILLCIFSNTVNAAEHMLCTMAICTVSGWAGILISTLMLKPARAYCEHAAGLEKEEEVLVTGTISDIGQPFHIPNSIDAVRILIETEGEVQTLHVIYDKAMLLPACGSRVKLIRKRTYVWALEVLK